MKKQRLYLLGACLLLGGLITAYLGYLYGAHNHVFMDNRGRVSLAEERLKTLRVDEAIQFSSIAVDADVLDIEIVPASEFSIDAKYFAVDPIEVSVEDGVLTIKAERKKSAINIGVSLGDENYMKIAVPEGLKLDAVTVHGDVGRISVGAIEAENVLLTSAVGGIDISGVKAGAIEASSATGDISISDADFAKCVARSNVGGVFLRLIGEREDYTLNLSTNVGSVHVEGEEGSYLNRGERLVDASANVGEVRVSFGR